MKPVESGWIAVAGCWTFFALIAGMAILSLYGDASLIAKTGPLLLFAPGPIFLLGAILKNSFALDRKAKPADLALLEDAQTTVYLVELMIIRDTEVAGKDRGVLGLLNGALFFNGQKCSFQIGSQDLDSESLSSRAKNLDREAFTPQHMIQLRNKISRLRLAFNVLTHPSWNRKEKNEGLKTMLREFEAASPTTEPRSYPPTW